MAWRSRGEAIVLAVVLVGCSRAEDLKTTLARMTDDLDEARVLAVVDDAPLAHRLAELGLDRVEVVQNAGRLGQGARLKAGYTRALALRLDPIVSLRGDGAHDPASVGALLRLVRRGAADVAVGSRLIDRAKGLGLVRRLAIDALSTVQAGLSGLEVRDPHGGLRVFSRAALAQVSFEALSDGRPFESELLLALHERGARIAELPIDGNATGALPLNRALPYAARCLTASARAGLARVRGVLAFPGPPNLPPSDAPSVTLDALPSVQETESRNQRPLSVVQPDGEMGALQEP